MTDCDKSHPNSPASNLTFALHPITGVFQSRATEHAFQRHHLAQTRMQLRLTLVFCSFFYLAFALTDFAALGDRPATWWLLLARGLVAVTATVGLVLLARQPDSIRLPPLIATAVEIVGMGTFLLIVLHRPYEIPWHAMSISIMLVVVYLFIPNALAHATQVALAATLAFNLLVRHLGTLTTSDMFTMSMLLVLTNTFGIVAARRYHRLWRDEFRVHTTLQELAVRDPLTGCYNRRYLQDQCLDREIKRARRYQHWLTVILCDIDHFKGINDRYGHLAGDAVLSQLGRLLHASTRTQVDTIVRYGGEEFLLVLPETDLASAVRLTERVRTVLAESPLAYGTNAPLRVTASFGVLAVNFATAMPDEDPEALIAAADELLYRAKQAGRNRIEFSARPWTSEMTDVSEGFRTSTENTNTGVIQEE